MSGSGADALIKREAEEILHGAGFLKMLSEFGEPTVVGSYALDLMVWRDLDVYLEVDTPDPVTH